MNTLRAGPPQAVALAAGGEDRRAPGEVPVSGETSVAITDGHDLRRRLSIVSAAGPIVEVVAAAASLIVLYGFGWPNFAAEPAPHMMIAFASLSLLAATAIGGAHGLATDVVHLSRYASMTDGALAERYAPDR